MTSRNFPGSVFAKAASPSDIKEVSSGKGSARDKAEAAHPDGVKGHKPLKRHSRPSKQRHPNRRKNG